MTQAVCFSCGSFKQGAFDLCASCRRSPYHSDEVSLSLLMTDHCIDRETMSELGEAIRKRRRPSLKRDLQRQVDPLMRAMAARDLIRRITGDEPPWTNAGLAPCQDCRKLLRGT